MITVGKNTNNTKIGEQTVSLYVVIELVIAEWA